MAIEEKQTTENQEKQAPKSLDEQSIVEDKENKADAQELYRTALRGYENGDVEWALSVWKSLAEREGSSMAMANLGDHYYHEGQPESWDQAYLYYTMEGAMPQSAPRRRNITDIINHGRFQGRVLRLTIAFLIATAGMIAVSAMLPLFSFRPLFAVLCLILEAAAAALAIHTYRRNPYRSLRPVLPVMFGIWCVYVLLWIL